MDISQYSRFQRARLWSAIKDHENVTEDERKHIQDRAILAVREVDGAYTVRDGVTILLSYLAQSRGIETTFENLRELARSVAGGDISVHDLVEASTSVTV